MKLTLLRHGETEGSRNGLYYGAANIPVQIGRASCRERV